MPCSSFSSPLSGSIIVSYKTPRLLRDFRMRISVFKDEKGYFEALLELPLRFFNLQFDDTQFQNY